MGWFDTSVFRLSTPRCAPVRSRSRAKTFEGTVRRLPSSWLPPQYMSLSTSLPFGSREATPSTLGSVGKTHRNMSQFIPDENAFTQLKDKVVVMTG